MPTSHRSPLSKQPVSVTSDRRPVTQADVAAARGCARSTVHRAVQPGGALHPALIPGTDRIDAAHPAHRAFLGPVSIPTIYGLTLREAFRRGIVGLDGDKFPRV